MVRETGAWLCLALLWAEQGNLNMRYRYTYMRSMINVT